MKMPGKNDRDDSHQLSDGAIRFIIYFTLASGVPVFAGIILGIENHNTIIGIGACIVMVVVNIVMMLCVRKREKKRQWQEKRARTDLVQVNQANLTVARMLAGGGVILVNVSIYLNLANISTSWLSVIIGLIGGALLLAAGFVTKRGIRDHW